MKWALAKHFFFAAALLHGLCCSTICSAPHIKFRLCRCIFALKSCQLRWMNFGEFAISVWVLALSGPCCRAWFVSPSANWNYNFEPWMQPSLEIARNLMRFTAFWAAWSSMPSPAVDYYRNVLFKTCAGFWTASAHPVWMRQTELIRYSLESSLVVVVLLFVVLPQQ